jgi:radical SAM protein with 4Fe4S-binding SPASM domain
MTLVEEDKFPVLSKNVTIHCHPQGCLVNIDEMMPSGINRSLKSKVNKVGREILIRCNGGLSIWDIAKDISNNEPTSQVYPQVLSFLEEAETRKHISYYNEPKATEINITGSKKYFVPIRLSIELILDCNIECIHCYRLDSNSVIKRGRLNTEDLLSIIKFFSENGTRMVELTGGEPLMHPHFNSILDFCAKHFKYVVILSNGTLIDEKVAKIIGSYKNVFVQISLHGSTPYSHDSFVRKDGAFNKTINGISLLSKENVFVRVAMTVTPQNMYDIENTLLLSQDIGAKVFIYSPFVPLGRGKNIEIFTLKQAQEMAQIHSYLENNYKNGIFFTVSSETFEKIRQLKNCGAGYETCVLSSDGAIRPCPLFSDKYKFLDLSKNITNAFKLKKFKGDYFYHLISPSENTCGDCKYISICKSCIARGIVQSEKIGEACKWGEINKISKLRGMFLKQE